MITMVQYIEKNSDLGQCREVSSGDRTRDLTNRDMKTGVQHNDHGSRLSKGTNFGNSLNFLFTSHINQMTSAV